MPIATSRVRSSPFFNSLSCRIFLCLFPTTSCWINRSSYSALSLRLHFEAWIRQRCRKTLIWFCFFCFSCYSWFLANTWFTLAPTCLSNHAQISAGLLRAVFGIFPLPVSFTSRTPPDLNLLQFNCAIQTQHSHTSSHGCPKDKTLEQAKETTLIRDKQDLIE